MSSEENKLYVGNLSYDLSEDELKNVFAEKGFGVQSVTIIKDKFTQRSKGFGFVELQSSDDLDRGISEVNGVPVKGRNINVSKARPRSERPDGGGRPDRGDRGGHRPPKSNRW